MLAGWAMTGGDGPAAPLRRLALAGLCAVPGGLAQRVLDRGSPPLRPGPLVAPAAGPLGVGRRGLVGHLAPPAPPRTSDADPRAGGPGGGAGPGAVTPRARRRDRRSGPRFVVLASVPPDPALHRLGARLDASVLTLQHDALPSGLTALVVRPDGYVLAEARSRTTPGVELLAGSGAWLPLVGGG